MLVPVLSRRGRVHSLPCHRVDNEVLTQAELTRSRRTPADALYQALVDLTDQCLSNGLSTADILGHKVKGFSVVEQLAHIVRVGLGNPLTGKQLG
jgi:hypothetical protein